MMKFDFGSEAEETDKVLENDIKKLEAVSETELQELLPRKADQDELKALIEAVKGETNDNKRNALMIEHLGSVSKIVKDTVENLIG